MTRNQIKAQAARYVKFVDWSDENRCFIGRCPRQSGRDFVIPDQRQQAQETTDSEPITWLLIKSP